MQTETLLCKITMMQYASILRMHYEHMDNVLLLIMYIHTYIHTYLHIYIVGIVNSLYVYVTNVFRVCSGSPQINTYKSYTILLKWRILTLYKTISAIIRLITPK